MKRFLILAAVVLWASPVLKANEPVPALSGKAFAEWKATMEFSAKRLGETVLISFDAEKKLLVVKTELALNDARKNTLLQTVPVAFLSPEIELEGKGQLQEPWIRLRCQTGKKVRVQRRVVIDGVEVSELSKDEDKPFLVISCQRNDLKKAKEQGEAFLGSEIVRP
jgi:hypothetical protein